MVTTTGPPGFLFTCTIVRALQVYDLYMGRQFGNKPPSGTNKKDLIEEIRVRVAAEKGNKACQDYVEASDDTVLGDKCPVPRPLGVVAPRTFYGILITIGPLGANWGALSATHSAASMDGKKTTTKKDKYESKARLVVKKGAGSANVFREEERREKRKAVEQRAKMAKKGNEKRSKQLGAMSAQMAHASSWEAAVAVSTPQSPHPSPFHLATCVARYDRLTLNPSLSLPPSSYCRPSGLCNRRSL